MKTLIPENIEHPEAVLSKEEILRRIDLNSNNSQKLFVTPLINIKNQIDRSAITLRLGNEFVTFRRTKFSGIDPLKMFKSKALKTSPHDFQEKTYVELGKKIVLHPHQLILGSSLEYVGMPNDTIGNITARSSWGRLGLVIATAIVIHPTYKGVITLELANYGDSPIALYPGTRVAQLILSHTKPQEDEINTKYMFSTSPGYSQIYEDPEWELFSEFRS